MTGARVTAIVWTVLIVGLCTIPGEDLPKVDIVSADKIGHFAMFFVFGWLWLRVQQDSGRVRRTPVLILGLAFAALTELYQGLLPFERQPDVFDVAANALGLFSAVALFTILNRQNERAA